MIEATQNQAILVVEPKLLPAYDKKAMVQEKLLQAKTDLLGFCREEPLKAMGIALVGGFAIGKLLHLVLRGDPEAEKAEKRRLKWKKDFYDGD